MSREERFEKSKTEKDCPINVHEEVEISVPCEVRAFSRVKEVKIKCDGGPVVICDSDDKVCKFKVRQRVCIDIPIEIHTEVDVDKGHVEFEPCPLKKHHHKDDCGCEGEYENEAEDSQTQDQNPSYREPARRRV